METLELAQKHFPNIPEGQVREAIELCKKADGFYEIEDFEDLSVAFFFYHPGTKVDGKRMFEIVRDWDIDTLKRLDLTEGPILHVVFFAAEKRCYEIFRGLVDAINPQGVSAHRYKKNGQRHFSLRKNVGYRDET